MQRYIAIPCLAVISLFSEVAWGSHETELRSRLMKSYDLTALPEVLTNLSVGFTVLGIQMDEKAQVLNLDTWVKMEWSDSRLSWSPAAFPNIERLAIPSNLVWLPDLLVYNNAKMNIASHFTNTNVVVWPSGKVLWVPTANLPATCVLDMTYWPNDVHNCTTKLGSWVHSGFTINLKPFDGKHEVTFDIPEKSVNGRTLARGEWEVLNSSVSYNNKYYPCCVEPYMHVALQIVVKRNAPAYCWAVKVPAVVLALLTGALFLLPPASLEKAVVGALVLLLDMQFIAYTKDVVEHSPSHTPLIVQFVSEQLLLTVICMFASLVIVRLSRDPHTDGPPAWLQRPLSTLEVAFCVTGYRKLASASKQCYSNAAMGQPGDAGEDQAVMVEEGGLAGNRSTVTARWLLLGAVLDRTLLLIYVCAFFIKLIAYNGIF